MTTDSSAAIVGVLVSLLISAGLYVWISLALAAVFRKSGVEPWKAWVPILNSIVLLQIAGLSPWFLLLGLVPVAGLALVVVFAIALYRISVAFGFGAGMTVLGVLLLPVWATVIGFGSARWVGREATDAGPRRTSAATGAPAPVAGDPPPLPPFRAATATASGYEGFAPAPSAPASPGYGEAGPPPPLPSAGIPPIPPIPGIDRPAPAPATTAFAPASAAAHPGPLSSDADAAGSAPLSSDEDAEDAGAADAGAADAADDAGAGWGPPPVPGAGPQRRRDDSGADADPDDDDDADDADGADDPQPAPRRYGGFDLGAAGVTDLTGEVTGADSGAPSPIAAVPATGAAADADDAAPSPQPAVRSDAAPTPVAALPAAVFAAPNADESMTRPPVTRVPSGGARRAEQDPWAPMPSGDGESDAFPESSGPVSAIAGAPDAGTPRSALGAVSAQHVRQPDTDGEELGDLDRTVIASRRHARWALELPVGGPVELTGEIVLVGRRPAPSTAYPGAQLVTVDDGTISRTHLRLQREGDQWSVTDLQSTNGTVVFTPDGGEIEIEPGSAQVVTERFLAGDAELRLTRDLAD